MEAESCLLCGTPQPVGHVIVRQKRKRVGRICSSHTLREVIGKGELVPDKRRLAVHVELIDADE